MEANIHPTEQPSTVQDYVQKRKQEANCNNARNYESKLVERE